ncbi:MAG TPA: pentapeptide repeat-containing protein [Bacillus sp. (in: firmicutes)]|nr:pentapeptide repeat-containing protein [Bacillus sp. (in: firmicutes)]
MTTCGGFGDKVGLCKNEVFDAMRSPYCKNCAGKSFENQVSRIFEIQGYKVTNNISLSGTQNDILAQIKIGVTSISILIECKFKFDETVKVDSEDVRKFHGSKEIFHRESKYGVIDKAYIVTNAQFAPQAYETAHILSVNLFTEQELVKNLMDFTPYLRYTIKMYENSHLFHHYIELNSVNDVTMLEEIEEFLRYDDPALVILGDYGTGKTSFCTNLCYRLANDYLSGKDVPIPILIQLRDYERAVSLQDLITSFLVNKWKIPNGNFETFIEILEMGYIVLIFDGFDEIARRVDYATKYKVFAEISKFADYNSKIIVTCRKNFFNHREEFEKIFKATPLHYEPNLSTVDFVEVEIEKLNEDQIYDYIYSYEKVLKSKGYEVEDFIQVMNSIHDLSDLAKRPVLLNVIIETIPQLVIEEGTKVNAALLYEKYTGFWLEREDFKGKTLIRSEQKMLFSKQLAWKMFNKNTQSIMYNQIPKEVKEYFNITDFDDVDHFSHDIKSCSFLHNDDNKGYKFIHKSFMEYFTAQYILSELDYLKISDKKFEMKIIKILGETLITNEVGFFIKDLIEVRRFNKETIISKLKTINLNRIEIICKKNIISLYSKLGENITNIVDNLEDLSGVDLSGAIIKNGVIKKGNLLGVSFQNASLKNIKFQNCILTDAVFRNSKLIDVQFIQCDIEGSDYSNSEIIQCTFMESTLAYAKFHSTTISQTDFDQAELTEADIDENSEFIGCYNLDSVIGLPYILSIS